MPIMGADLLVIATAALAAVCSYQCLCRAFWPAEETEALIPWHHYLLDEDLREADRAQLAQAVKESILLYALLAAACWATLIFLLASRT